MRNYIYELLQASLPKDEWTSEWDLSEYPDAFSIASRIGEAEDRDGAINRFGAWLEENRLGKLEGLAFTLEAKAADRCFVGRFTEFQKAVAALQQLNEMQFIHEHDQVQQLIDQLCDIFTQTYGDYVL